MTPHVLLANFEVLVEAPNGIQRLRELVLELAVRGRLVEQEAGDEPVCESLRRVLGQQQALKRPDGLFELPKSWAWVSGEEAFSFITSGSRGWAQYCASEGPIFLRIGNLDYGTTALDLRDIQRVNPPTGAEGQRTATRPGDVLVSITGDTGMVGLVPEGFDTAYINQHIALCRPAIATWASFLATVMLAPFAQDQFRAGERGVKKSLGLGDIKGLRLPIPPEAEQLRIMTRVDELMALLDRLEAKRQEREAARTAARDSALAALRESPTPDDVETAWLRIQERFHELFAKLEDVELLQQAILQLAVRGRLVHQDATDLPISPQSGRKGRRLVAKVGSALGNEVVSPDLPSGWILASLQDLLREPLANGRSVPDGVNGYPVLRLSALRREFVNLNDFKVGSWTESQGRPFAVHAGDFLVARGNGSKRLVGRGALVQDSAGVAFPDTMIRIRLDDTCLNTGLFRHIWDSDLVRSQIENKARTTSGIFKVSQENLEQILLPVPPMREQARILAIVERLFAATRKLQFAARSMDELQQAFAAASVHHMDA